MLKKISIKKMKPVLGLILFSVVITIIRPNFMTSANLLNVLRQTSINAIIAAGMTFVILTGGIDLSVGSILAFSSAVGVWMLQTGNGIAVSVLVCLVIGALAGLFNSVVITRGNIQPFIATLATMTLLRGATLVFTGGKPLAISFSKDAINLSSLCIFQKIGSGKVLGIPIPIIIMIVVFLLCWHILRNMAIGR